MTGVFVRSDVSSATVCIDDTENVASASAGDTEPDDRIECAVPVTGELHQGSLMSADTETRQATLGWFLVVNKLFVLPLQ